MTSTAQVSSTAVAEVYRIAGRMGLSPQDFSIQTDFFTSRLQLVVIHPSGVYRHHLLSLQEGCDGSEMEVTLLLRSRAVEALCPRACDYA